MKLSEIIFIAALIPAALLGLSGLGVITGHFDSGVFVRAALVAAGPVLAIVAAGFTIRHKASQLAERSVVAAVAHEAPLRRAA